MKHRPPRLADRLLAWFCALHLLEDLQGDLHELFRLRVERHGARVAQLCYWIDVIRSFRPYVLRRQPTAYQQARGPIMLRSYFTVAMRNVRRQKGYAFLNISGLAIGMAVCLLILLYVQDELSYDRFHALAADTYRLVLESSEGERSGTMSASLGPALAQENAEVQTTVRLFKHWEAPLIARADDGFIEEAFYFADSSFFGVFSFPLRQGDTATALAVPFSVVLTEAMARKYFGSANPLRQTLRYNSDHDLTVTGVMADVPHNSHLQPDFVASMPTLPQVSYEHIMEQWGVFYHYIVLEPGASPTMLMRKGQDLLTRRAGDGVTQKLHSQPLTSIHLQSHLSKELEANGDIRYVYLLSSIGLLLLLIACINYMNLATARSMRRAREVGIRKAAGAQRGQIVRQFFGESFLLAFLALALALTLVTLLLPAFNQLSGKALSLSSIYGTLLPGSIAVTLVVALLAGSYPAIFLSRFKPVEVLKGPFKSRSEGHGLRTSLVVVQFAASVVLITSTLVISQQLQFVRDAELGFEEEQVVAVAVQDPALRQRYMALRDSWLREASVLSVGATSSAYPGKSHSDGHTLRRDGFSDEEGLDVLRNWVDATYLGTLGIDLLVGAGFSPDEAGARDEIVLNEAAVRALGWTTLEEALDQPLTLNDEPFHVVGVTPDFHFNSLHHRVEPLVLTPAGGSVTNLLVQVQIDDLPQTLAGLEATWKTFSEQPFSYTFLDDQFDALYRADAQWGQIVRYASLLAILIACLGLFGLAAFTAEQRTKEIGIRKVLGATVPHLLLLLTRHILLLVGVAFVIAVPISYVAMSRWLEGFAYRIELSWSLFAIAGLAALVIALLTVSYQSIRAALSDPIKSLRYE
ncbi:MAG TPA: ABC transporter permease [Rhodothermales bacterium]|nr:ABC transporter permease [Rhodothermales bacterium]